MDNTQAEKLYNALTTRVGLTPQNLGGGLEQFKSALADSVKADKLYTALTTRVGLTDANLGGKSNFMLKTSQPTATPINNTTTTIQATTRPAVQPVAQTPSIHDQFAQGQKRIADYEAEVTKQNRNYYLAQKELSTLKSKSYKTDFNSVGSGYSAADEKRKQDLQRIIDKNKAAVLENEKRLAALKKNFDPIRHKYISEVTDVQLEEIDKKMKSMPNTDTFMGAPKYQFGNASVQEGDVISKEGYQRAAIKKATLGLAKDYLLDAKKQALMAGGALDLFRGLVPKELTNGTDAGQKFAGVMTSLTNLFTVAEATESDLITKIKDNPSSMTSEDAIAIWAKFESDKIKSTANASTSGEVGKGVLDMVPVLVDFAVGMKGAGAATEAIEGGGTKILVSLMKKSPSFATYLKNAGITVEKIIQDGAVKNVINQSVKAATNKGTATLLKGAAKVGKELTGAADATALMPGTYKGIDKETAGSMNEIVQETIEYNRGEKKDVISNNIYKEIKNGGYASIDSDEAADLVYSSLDSKKDSDKKSVGLAIANQFMTNATLMLGGKVGSKVAEKVFSGMLLPSTGKAALQSAETLNKSFFKRVYSGMSDLGKITANPVSLYGSGKANEMYLIATDQATWDDFLDPEANKVSALVALTTALPGTLIRFGKGGWDEYKFHGMRKGIREDITKLSTFGVNSKVVDGIKNAFLAKTMSDLSAKLKQVASMEEAKSMTAEQKKAALQLVKSRIAYEQALGAGEGAIDRFYQSLDPETYRKEYNAKRLELSGNQHEGEGVWVQVEYKKRDANGELVKDELGNQVFESSFVKSGDVKSNGEGIVDYGKSSKSVDIVSNEGISTIDTADITHAKRFTEKMAEAEAKKESTNKIKESVAPETQDYQVAVDKLTEQANKLGDNQRINFFYADANDIPQEFLDRAESVSDSGTTASAQFKNGLPVGKGTSPAAFSVSLYPSEVKAVLDGSFGKEAPKPAKEVVPKSEVKKEKVPEKKEETATPKKSDIIDLSELDKEPVAFNEGDIAYDANGKKGQIKMEGTTKVFDTGTEIYELNPEREATLSKTSPNTVDVVTKKEFTYNGDRYEILSIERKKDGSHVVKGKRILSEDKGVKKYGTVKRLTGKEADIVAKEHRIGEEPVQESPKIKGAKTKGISKEPAIEKPIEKTPKKPVTKEQVDVMTEKEFNKFLENEAKEQQAFEKKLEDESSNKVKENEHLFVEYKGKEYLVRRKANGEYVIMDMSGKAVRGNERVGISEAYDTKFNKENKAIQEELEIAKAESKAKSEDRMLQAIDKAIAFTNLKGKTFVDIGGVTVVAAVANSALKIIRAAYVGGKTLVEAVADGYKYMESKGYKFSDAEFKQFVKDYINKGDIKEESKKVTQQKPSPIKDTKTEAKIASLIDKAKDNGVVKASALKDLAKTIVSDFNKAIRDTRKSDSEKIISIRDVIKDYAKEMKLKLSASQYNAVISAVAYAVKKGESPDVVVEKISSYIANNDLARSIDSATKAQKALGEMLRNEKFRKNFSTIVLPLATLSKINLKDVAHLLGEEQLNTLKEAIIEQIKGHTIIGKDRLFETKEAAMEFAEKVASVHGLLKINEKTLNEEAKAEYDKIMQKAKDGTLKTKELIDFIGYVDANRTEKYYKDKFRQVSLEGMSAENKAAYEEIRQNGTVSDMVKFMDNMVLNRKNGMTPEAEITALEKQVSELELPETYEGVAAYKRASKTLHRRIKELQQQALNMEDNLNPQVVFERAVALEEKLSNGDSKLFNEKGELNISGEAGRKIIDDMHSNIANNYESIKGNPALSPEVLHQIDRLYNSYKGAKNWSLTDKELNQLDMALSNMEQVVPTRKLGELLQEFESRQILHNEVAAFESSIVRFKSDKAMARLMQAGSLAIDAHDKRLLQNRLSEGSSRMGYYLEEGRYNKVRKIVRPIELAIRRSTKKSAEQVDTYFKFASKAGKDGRRLAYMLAEENRYRTSSIPQIFKLKSGELVSCTYKELMDAEGSSINGVAVTSADIQTYKSTWKYQNEMLLRVFDVAKNKDAYKRWNESYKKFSESFNVELNPQDVIEAYSKGTDAQKAIAALYNHMIEIGNESKGREEVNALYEGVTWGEQNNYVPNKVIQRQSSFETKEDFAQEMKNMYQQGLSYNKSSLVKSSGKYQKDGRIHFLETDPNHIFPRRIKETNNEYYAKTEINSVTKAIGRMAKAKEDIINELNREINNTTDAVEKERLYQELLFEKNKKTVFEALYGAVGDKILSALEYDGRNKSRLISFVNKAASYRALSKPFRPLVEFASNISRVVEMGQNPVSTIYRYNFSGEKALYEKLLSEEGSAVSESINPYIEMSSEFRKRIGDKPSAKFITAADNAVAAPAVISELKKEFKKATGEKFDFDEYSKKGDYTDKHRDLVNEIIMNADQKIEQLFVERDAATAGTKVRVVPFFNWYASTKNPIMMSLKFMTRMADQDMFYTKMGAMEIIRGDAVKGARMISSRAISNASYFYLMNIMGAGMYSFATNYWGTPSVKGEYDEDGKLINVNMDDNTRNTFAMALAASIDDAIETGKDWKNPLFMSLVNLGQGGHSSLYKAGAGMLLATHNSYSKEKLEEKYTMLRDYLYYAQAESMASKYFYAKPLGGKLEDVPLGSLSFLVGKPLRDYDRALTAIGYFAGDKRVEDFVDVEGSEKTRVAVDWYNKQKYLDFCAGVANLTNTVLPNVYSSIFLNMFDNRGSIVMDAKLKKQIENMTEEQQSALLEMIENGTPNAGASLGEGALRVDSGSSSSNPVAGD